MFKQIFENKIGEKLNNFNNSGKVAFEWMDKFRQSLDITEKIQQQFNYTNNSNQSNTYNSNESLQKNLNQVHSSSTSQNSPNLNISNQNETVSYRRNSFKRKTNNINNNSASINSNTLSSSFSLKKDESSEFLNNFEKQDEILKINNSSYYTNPSPPLSPSNPQNPSLSSFNSLSTPKASFKSNRSHSANQAKYDQNNQINQSNESNDCSPSSSSSLSQKSADYNVSSQTNNLQQSNSVTEETLINERPIIGGSSNSRRLVRQSTDLTTSFPLKPFQKINSETVEIPGLNVKVVRYRIENDLGKIEPHLYIKYNSGGMDTNPTATRGKIYFSLRYNEEIQSFSVTINKAEVFNQSKQSTSNSLNASSLTLNSKTTPNSPCTNKPDTYVKIQLLPDKKKKYQTKIQRKTSQPVFEETFYFQLPFEELQNKTLYLSYLEFGRFSKHELIGAVKITDLNLIKDLQANDVEFIRNLLPLADDDLELGELTLTLCYLPAAGRLTVTIVKAINLKAMDINGKSDPYVKVSLITKGKRVKKKKTSVMKNTLHPVYNESMLFDIPQDQIEHVDMLVKVIDYDRVGSNELIGCIGIGPSFSGIGRDHWYRMLENPRKPITQSYFLKDSNFLREGLPAKIQKALNSDRQESVDSRGIDF